MLAPVFGFRRTVTRRHRCRSAWTQRGHERPLHPDFPRTRVKSALTTGKKREFSLLAASRCDLSRWWLRSARAGRARFEFRPRGADICRSDASRTATAAEGECHARLQGAGRDALFLLNDVFHIERFANLPGFADASPDVLQAMFGPPRRGSARRYSPRSTGWATKRGAAAAIWRVATPPGFKDAYRRYVEAADRHFDAPSYGGLGLPVAVTQVIGEFLISANLAFPCIRR